MKNPFSSTRIFFVEMIDELKKCAWPTRSELIDSTVIVIASTLLLGLFTAISDFSVSQVVELLTTWTS